MTKLAFTTSLRGFDDTKRFDCPPDPLDPLDPQLECVPDPTTPFPVTSVERSTSIENGRMPVFDPDMVHHFDPGMDPAYVDPTTGDMALVEWPVNRPGERYHLPWGQFVFDYFTALPLYSLGPYGRPPGVLPGNFVPSPSAQPRVDMDGLRVHGRMNLNAAPWKALLGLPLMPMNDMPEAVRTRLRAALGPDTGVAPGPGDVLVRHGTVDPVEDHQAGIIPWELAESIAAYREIRAVDDYLTGTTTEDFGRPADGRGWEWKGPSHRRGTGFMTVGELANIRHPDKGASVSTSVADRRYRIDLGAMDDDAPDEEKRFTNAVALLVALGDWVTVRSHVFTVYGTIRGEPAEADINGVPETAQDVDARALRFQETLDRLPVFLGADEPVRIGERVLSNYTDIRND